MQHPALLKLMYLVSPALPVGAYAYSQGQEYAVDSNWLADDGELEAWIHGIMAHGIGMLDAPCLIRLYDAWQIENFDNVSYWNSYLLASRETSELLLEDEQLGMALARLLVSLGLTGHQGVLAQPVSFTTLFAYVGVAWEIPKTELMYGFIWAWLENQIAAATKSVPLGQTHAQQLATRLIEHIPAIVVKAHRLIDEDIGASLAGLAIASAKHERQYSRLFRS